MITMTPLPRWLDLSAALLPGSGPDDGALAEPWRRGGEAAFWFSRSAWALQAIVLWWESLHGRRPSLWLPDYFCNHPTAPLRRSETRLVFYPVGDDLEPDWGECRTMAAAGPPDLFVLVHYFGLAADAGRARAFCDAEGALLIEDGAHALGPSAAIGGNGDFVFYSPHKLLALADGGLLLVRDPAQAQAMAAASNNTGWNGLRAPNWWPWTAKRMVQKILPAAVGGRLLRRRMLPFEEDPPFARLDQRTRITPLSRRMIAKASRQLDAAAAARRRNAEALARSLDGLAGCRPLAGGEGGQETVPYRLVLRFDDPAAAAACYDDFRKLGLPAESWPDLPPEVLGHPRRHATAIKLRRTQLLLPVHQTAPADELAVRYGKAISGRKSSAKT